MMHKSHQSTSNYYREAHQYTGAKQAADQSFNAADARFGV
jgi:hypothetical protein